MKQKYIIGWACDFSNFRGEGILSRNFASQLSKYKNIIIYLKSNDGVYKVDKGKIIQIKKKNSQINFFTNYITPFFGIFYLWYFFLQNKKILYLNYLPLWNSILFLLLPPTTMFGPITGGSIINKSNLLLYFIRKYLFPILYFISIVFINLRGRSVIFSTDLLIKYKNYLKVNNFFLFCLTLYRKKSLKTKSIELLIYYRFHRNKGTLNLIKNFNLSRLKNVYCIGDKLNIKKVINLGNISNKKAMLVMSKARYTINSTENYLSLFLIDSISNNCTVLLPNNQRNILKYFPSKHFLFYKTNKKFNLNKEIKNNFKIKNKTNFKNSLKQINLRFKKFIKEKF